MRRFTLVSQELYEWLHDFAVEAGRFDAGIADLRYLEQTADKLDELSAEIRSACAQARRGE